MNSRNTSYNARESVLSPRTIKSVVTGWMIGPSAGPWAADQTVVVGGVAYFAIPNGIYAVNPLDGTIIWSDAIGGGPVAAYGGSLYVASNDGHLYDISESTGAVAWSFNFGPANSEGAPTVVGGVVYFGGGTSIYALSATTSAVIWSYSNGDTASSSFSSPAISGNRLFIMAGYALLALTVRHGALLWRATIAGPFFESDPVVAGDIVYEQGDAGSYDGLLQAFDAGTGALVWQISSWGFGGSMALGNGVLYAVFGGNLNAVDVRTATIKWSTPANDFAGSMGVTVAGGLVYYEAPNADLAAARVSNGAEVWDSGLASGCCEGSYNSGVVVADGQILFGASSGNEYDLHLP